MLKSEVTQRSAGGGSGCYARASSIRESAELIAKAIDFKGELVFQTKYQDGALKKILDAQQFKKIFPDYKFIDHYKGICNTVNYYQSVFSNQTNYKSTYVYSDCEHRVKVVNS